MTIDAFLERRKFQHGVQIERLGFGDFPFQPNRPWRSSKIPREPRGLFFVRAELVEVVITSDDGKGSELLVCEAIASLGSIKLRRRRASRSCQHGGAGGQKPPAVQVVSFRGDMGPSKLHPSLLWQFQRKHITTPL